MPQGSVQVYRSSFIPSFQNRPDLTSNCGGGLRLALPIFDVPPVFYPRLRSEDLIRCTWAASQFLNLVLELSSTSLPTSLVFSLILRISRNGCHPCSRGRLRLTANLMFTLLSNKPLDCHEPQDVQRGGQVAWTKKK